MIEEEVKCEECGCTSTAEQVKNMETQHWNNCSQLSEREPMETDEAGVQQDR